MHLFQHHLSRMILMYSMFFPKICHVLSHTTLAMTIPQWWLQLQLKNSLKSWQVKWVCSDLLFWISANQSRWWHFRFWIHDGFLLDLPPILVVDQVMQAFDSSFSMGVTGRHRCSIISTHSVRKCIVYFVLILMLHPTQHIRRDSTLVDSLLGTWLFQVAYVEIYPFHILIRVAKSSYNSWITTWCTYYQES